MMERLREARRATMMAGAGSVANGGLSRRKQRSGSLRDSPEEDGPAGELPEMARLRERPGKKERDRDRERERDREVRDRDRERERERERERSSRSKRRRGELRMIHGALHREDGGEESSDDSLGDEEEDDDDGSAAIRLPPPPPVMLNHHHHINHHQQPHHPSSLSSSPVSMAGMGLNHQRKSFPAKIIRTPAAPTTLKVADEMIGVAVPRKARSASVKRSHESWVLGGSGGGSDPALRQSSMSPARPATSPAAAGTPISPSSSNVSARKKLKPMGAKQHQHPQHHHRPPKILRAASSSPIQDDIEIEVAEVLYGLKSSKQETFSAKDSYEDKLRVSSPSSAISPQAGVLQNSGSLPNSSSGAIAPKRKRPRPVKYEEENLAAVPVAFSSPNASATSTAKPEAELPVNAEVSSPKLHAAENGGTGPQIDLQRELAKQDGNLAVADLKLPVATEVSDMKEESAAAATTTSMRELSPRIKLDVNLEDSSTELKSQSVVAAAGDGLREDKFKIDLMAPPSAKSSPERDSIPDLMADQKPLLPDTEMGAKMEAMKAEEKEKAEDARLEERKAESMDKNSDSQKILSKERTLDPQLDIDQKQDKDVVNGSNKRQIFNLKQQARGTKGELMLEKSPLPAQSASLPAMSMALGGWPGGLPPLGYIGQVPPLPAIVSMDGSAGPSAAIQPPYFLLGQPRPKRCATHFYIAQTIRYHQQLARMNPFWPAAAGSAPIYGAKPYNLNMVPPESAVLGSQLPGPIAGRSSSSQDKASGASFPSQSTKEKSSASVANLMDATQRKQQFVLQQGPQPGSANNILGPPFIFPLNQQQAAAATARSGSMKSGTPVSNGASATISSSSIPGSGSVSAAPPATVSFNYANMPANEAQYLAILQNSGYPFPIPAQVGAPPPYRGSHGQPVPFFNGSFYSPQMLHPSQLQQQQAQSQPAAAPPVGHHTSTSSGSSSSQKHQQQQRSQGNGGTASSNFPTVKPRPPMPQLPPHPSRQFDSDVGGDENPSSTDSRAAAHAQKNASVVYNHNFAMPIHSQNFALMSPAAMAAHGDKTQQQQLPGMKGGVELGPSPFAMSFASPAGLDFSAMAPNHPLFQNLPEVARHQMAVAAAACAQAAAAQQKKSAYPRTAEEGKSSASDSTKQNKTEEERKKASSTGLHAHSFSRSDASDPSVSGNLAMESASRTLNLNLTNGNRSSRLNAGAPPTSAPSSVLTSVLSGPNSQLQQQQQQLIQIQKQHQQQIQNQIAGRTKSAASNNSPTYSDRHPAVAKFPNSMSVFPQALMQGNSPSQSPPWKASMTRPSSTPVASSSTTSPSVKGLPQQPGSRAQQPSHSTSSHAQISFSVSRKPGPPSQQLPANSSPPSSVVGSPTAKGGMSGSKPGSGLGSGPASTTLASQPAKNSPSSSRKSSPGSGSRNVPSILSNSHMSSSQSSSSKSLQQQQSQQQKIQPFQQAQLFFSNPYMQNQSTPNSASSGYYQRKPGEQQSSPSPQQNPSAPSSSGMLSLSSPMSLSGGITYDPAKAVAAATAAAAANNIKGLAPGVIHPAQFAAAQSAGNAHPLMSAFPYIHSLPAVPVKPNDQKPATGNDNLRTCWQPEKR